MAIEFKRAPGGGAEQLEAAEETAREQVAEWWRLAELEASYPASTATTIEILDAIGYSVDRTILAGYVNGNVIPKPPAVGGKIEWSALDIVHCQRALEARRRWQPFSLLHAHKLTLAERQQALAEQAGESTFCNDLEKFDLEGLLGLLVEMASQPEIVTVLAEAIRQKLKQAEVLK